MAHILDEIREQPDVLERTLRLERRGVERLKARLSARPPRLIVLVARGTSDNAALFGRYLLEITTGIPVSLAAPSIFTLYKASLDFSDTLVVAISQSGESTDTNLVLERARTAGALTAGITNQSSSTLAGLADHTFFVHAGRERSIAATKTYTGQLLMLYLLAYALGAKVGPDDLKRLPEWTAAALKMENEIAGRASRYRFMEKAVVVGRGLNYATAFEFGLKLMETCYVIAERFSSADFLHGPIAMVGASFPVFLFAPSGVTWASNAQMLGKLGAIGAETLLISDRSNAVARKASPEAVVLPARMQELFTPIPYIVPAQLFAAYLSVEKGLNPDSPRGLTKVTRTM
ncbi:MAG: SIS domain-containing protein [Bryobacteraceae bacterium]